ncbi:type I 3-dehydroquinate dehydratase [Neobacillus sedimentimangrovi]|jgi:3-dehydroquinate dehydratase I|uniref:3-dehydroquinate dehydratase n=2 Tax=Neobacillus TaxID=2675232 RepID=A0A6B3TRN4_9BACI|nr:MULTISPECIES: type I 3-dehydroquinate dehydratase [Neobacillus]AIM17240.1 3-dehydroquinate dehydratase [Bacillus sp. X1(2014)]MCD4838911.1 type I 3-dehydroquinate dehydratase [Neobacillus sedimentimangrovi]NEX79050.1 type I 3-dehydroquinate dehydratase [Neobacillus thermocopriae]
MKKIIKVKGLTIGEGAPKICVPMIGKTLKELKLEAEYIQKLHVDLVEWRVDFFEKVEKIEKVKQALSEIRSILHSTPIIFTFRSKREGGEKEINNGYYMELNKVVAETSLSDFIDIELFNEEQDIKKLIDTAHSNGVFVILSNHDFEKTPPKEEIISRLCKAQELDGDISKIAVMPNHPGDVITLLEAANTMNEKYADRPFITISMGDYGKISRFGGFGSAISFGVATNSSAPGQISVEELRKVLEILYK